MFGRVAASVFATLSVVTLLVGLPSPSGIAPDAIVAPTAAIAAPRDQTETRNPFGDTVEIAQAAAPLDVRAVPQAATPVEAPAPTSSTAADRVVLTVAPRPVTAPFGLDTSSVSGGDITKKWHGVEAAIRVESDILAHCTDAGEACPAAARNFLAIIAQGRALTGKARIGVINRAINLAIEPTSDLAQWGLPDRWSAPLETFTTGRGDCEDYAIAKYVALTAAGIAPDDVKLVIVRNTALDEDHAVVAVRLDGAWIVLDNRWLNLVPDRDMRQAIPRFVLDGTGVRRYAPPGIVASGRAAAPASF